MKVKNMRQRMEKWTPTVRQITRLELLDAVSDAMVYHASKALQHSPAGFDDSEAHEVERLKRLRTDLMADVPVERVTG